MRRARRRGGPGAAPPATARGNVPKLAAGRNRCHSRTATATASVRAPERKMP